MKIKKSLYKTIYDDLVNKILSGTFKGGEQLPSEAELDKKYNASRTPVRQALKQLENDGFIYRLQGKGSFVSNRRPTELWTKMTGFRSQYLDNWEKISAKTIAIDYFENKKISSILGIDEDYKLIHLKRVRYFDNKPVIYLVHFVSPKIPYSIFEKDENFISLGHLLKKHLDIEIVGAEEEIEAVKASKEIAKHLEVEENASLLKVTRFSYDEEENPIDINIYYVNTEEWKYKVNFTQEGGSYEDF